MPAIERTVPHSQRHSPRQGLQVFLFDYRGYGGNEGTPTEAGLRADADAARSYLIQRGDVDPSRLIYFGESLGTTLAIALAAEHPPAGVSCAPRFPHSSRWASCTTRSCPFSSFCGTDMR